MASDETVPMQYVMWIARDGVTTRYTIQLNDVICPFAVADWETEELRSPIGAVSSARKIAIEMRASVADELLWIGVQMKKPIYYARARALGWLAHRPIVAS